MGRCFSPRSLVLEMSRRLYANRKLLMTMKICVKAEPFRISIVIGF